MDHTAQPRQPINRVKNAVTTRSVRLLHGLMAAAIAVLPLAGAAGPLLASPHVASAATTTISSGCASGSTTLAVMQSGDKVSIMATLHSSDPDENGENETLLLQSSDGFSQGVGIYEQPQSSSFTASARNATLTGCISGYDGDESADVNVTVNSMKPSLYTDVQKKDLARSATTWSKAANAVGAVGLACIWAPDVTATKVCATIFGLIYAAMSYHSYNQSELTIDPPDSNYTVIALPVVHASSLQPIGAGYGETQQEADATNALLTNLEKSIALENAIITCINRTSGAFLAHDSTWQARQSQAGQQYSAQLATLTAAQAGLLANLQIAYHAAGVSQSFTAADARNFEASISSNGLPAEVSVQLTQLGADSQTQAQIAKIAVVQDNAGTAALGGGNFPALLSDPSFSAALQQETQSLEQAPLPADTPTKAPTATPVPPTKTPVPPTKTPVPLPRKPHRPAGLPPARITISCAPKFITSGGHVIITVATKPFTPVYLTVQVTKRSVAGQQTKPTSIFSASDHGRTSSGGRLMESLRMTSWYSTPLQVVISVAVRTSFGWATNTTAVWILPK